MLRWSHSVLVPADTLRGGLRATSNREIHHRSIAFRIVATVRPAVVAEEEDSASYLEVTVQV